MKILARLFSFKLLGAILGMVFIILQARIFGIDRSIEVYFAAQSLIYTVSSLTQSGQLAEIFLPEYLRLSSLRKGCGYDALNVILTRIFIWSVVVTIVMYLSAELFMTLIVPGFQHQEKAEAVHMFRALLPYILLQIFNSFFKTVMNADKIYGRPELLGAINLGFSCLILVAGHKYFGIWVLVYSLFMGKLIEFFFYTVLLYKNGFKIRFKYKIPEFDHVAFLRNFGHTLLYVSGVQISNVVITAGLSLMPQGSLAIYKYIEKIIKKVRGLFIQPFITIFFTEFTRVSQSNLEQRGLVYNKNSRVLLMVNLILLIFSVFAGEVGLKFLWGNTKFDLREISFAHHLLVFGLVGVLFITYGSLFRKMAVANGQARALYVGWTIIQFMSAIIAYKLLIDLGRNGLLIWLPMRALLTTIVSVMIFYRSVSYKWKLQGSGDFLLFLLLFFLSIGVKLILDQYLNIGANEYSILLLLSFILLSIFPLVLLIKMLRNE